MIKVSRADDGAHDAQREIPIDSRISLRIRDQIGILVPEREWQRYIRRVRQLDGSSSGWLAAAWAITGITATLAVGAATLPQHLILGVIAGLCAVGCAGCFIAHRDVNRKRKRQAEEVAAEMEEAAGIDRIEAALKSASHRQWERTPLGG